MPVKGADAGIRWWRLAGQTGFLWIGGLESGVGGGARMHREHLQMGGQVGDEEQWIGAFVHLCLGTLNLNSCHL